MAKSKKRKYHFSLYKLSEPKFILGQIKIDFAKSGYLQSFPKLTPVFVVEGEGKIEYKK